MSVIPPLNTMPIQQLITQIKSADASKQKEIRLDIESAKQLALTLGIVMTRLTSDMEVIIDKLLSERTPSPDVISVKLDGGNNW